jgi:hypothetical protein
MKMLRLLFCDFWPGFQPEDTIFMQVLVKHFEVEITDNPDFLIYSNFGSKYLNYDVPRVFYSSENIRPDFNLCDYALAFDRMVFGDRYYRFPIYLLERQRELHEIGSRRWSKAPKKFCTFIYSNDSADPARDEFFRLLSQYKKVDSGGRHLNNLGYAVADKKAFQKDYKFSIAFENSSTPGYSTEKIVDAYVAGTVPIYWGDPEIGRDFNTSSFVNAHDYRSLSEVVERVVELDRNDAMYRQMYEMPFFVNPIGDYSFTPGFENFLVHVFLQDKEAAFRRNRTFWGRSYENQQRKAAQYLERLERDRLFNFFQHLGMLGFKGFLNKIGEKLEQRRILRMKRKIETR